MIKTLTIKSSICVKKIENTNTETISYIFESDMYTIGTQSNFYCPYFIQHNHNSAGEELEYKCDFVFENYGTFKLLHKNTVYTAENFSAPVGEDFEIKFIINDELRYKIIAEYKIDTINSAIQIAINDFNTSQNTLSRGSVWDEKMTYDTILNGVEILRKDQFHEISGLNQRVVNRNDFNTFSIPQIIPQNNIIAYNKQNTSTLTYTAFGASDMVADQIPDALLKFTQGSIQECGLVCYAMILSWKLPVKYIYLIRAIYELGAFYNGDVGGLENKITRIPDALRAIKYDSIVKTDQAGISIVDWLFIAGFNILRNNIFQKPIYDWGDDINVFLELENNNHVGSNDAFDILFLFGFMGYNNINPKYFVIQEQDNVEFTPNTVLTDTKENLENYILQNAPHYINNNGIIILSLRMVQSKLKVRTRVLPYTSIKRKHQDGTSEWNEPTSLAYFLTKNNIDPNHSVIMLTPPTAVQSIKFNQHNTSEGYEFYIFDPSSGNKVKILTDKDSLHVYAKAMIFADYAT